MALVARAHAAASAAPPRAEECHALVWALRDLPRDSAVAEALRRQLPADGEGAPSRTLLQAAAAAGLEDSVRLLVEELPACGAACTKDSEGSSALHLAAREGHAAVTQLLLAKARAPANARDAAGRTALYLAAERGHARAARVLMRFGANPWATDGSGKTPLAVAAGPGDGAKGATLSAWLHQFGEKRRKASANVGKIKYFPALGSELPAHIVAPKLVLQAQGYCPEEGGKVKQLARGIRNNKKRAAPSTPNGKVNWYAPRG